MMNLPQKEKEILAFWEKESIFQKSLERNKGKKTFVFYEGPPTANGKPGIHHVLARAYKDIILRFKTMQGFYVPRKAGWDTHGLPVELEVEKELGINSKQEIEKYGVKQFITKAKESVWRYKTEWEDLTKRMGFWLDMDNPYITYEKNYIESLWFIIKTFWEKKLLEEGFKVVPWCYRCGTPLSSHELAQGYKKTKDTSVFVKFPISNFQFPIKSQIPNSKIYILSWTTTPWTLPGNVALAVGEDITYAAVKFQASSFKDEEICILAKDRLDVVKNNYEVIGEMKGKDLVGLAYEPLFDVPQLNNKKSHKVYAADFVNTQEGTGVVHTSVMYGEDDYQLGTREGLPKFHTVTEEGKFIDSLGHGLHGLPVKTKDTEEKIINYLKGKGLLFAVENYLHDYPFCWRCKSPLLYYATKSWFVKVSHVKKALLKNNEDINWVPAHLKQGRFGNFLEEAKDWAFSRARYWGTPLPIWRCGVCGELIVIGSLQELMEQAVPRNRFFLLRHCGAENNSKGIVSSFPEKEEYHLTEEGKCQAELLGQELKKERIDMIITSPLLRTRETAQIIAKATGASLHVDNRLREIDLGTYNGKTHKEYHDSWGSVEARFTKEVEGGENFHQVRVRMMQAFIDINQKYEGKHIALVTHKGPLWVLGGMLQGLSEKEISSFFHDDFRSGEMREVSCLLPFNDEGEVDLHRPAIDAIGLKCKKCKGIMKRVEDVVDVWFDSGAMPFAQAHWPLAQPSAISHQPSAVQSRKLKAQSSRLKGLAFPADYICEAVDQTRGWFYTLLGVSTLLGFGAPYKNVISLGHVLDEKGRKMSKSLGNIIDPFQAADEFGMDAIRWYFFVVNPPGFYKRFDPKEIRTHTQRFLLTLFNVLNFWKLYGQTNATSYKLQATSLLDRWIISRLNETIEVVTNKLDEYDIPSAARALEVFVDDLSNWYVRRSRARFQGKEKELVSGILYEILVTLSKLIAPFVPFSAEILYKELGVKETPKSIHITEWPTRKKGAIKPILTAHMQFIRDVVVKTLAKRAEVGIKIRQPLSKLKVKSDFARKGSAAKAELLKVDKETSELIKEEINVKEVILDKNIPDEVELDTTLTPELLEEGFVRELIRQVQDLRKQAGLLPNKKINLSFSPEIREVVKRWSSLITQKTGAKSISFGAYPSRFTKQLNFEGKNVTIGIDA